MGDDGRANPTPPAVSVRPLHTIRWLRSLGACLFIALITVVLLEGVLRLTVDRTFLYRGLSLYPDLNRKKFESAFSAGHADGQLSMATFDPHLGWDFDIGGDRIRGEAPYPRQRQPGRYRIVAIGDSFTYGTDVPNDRSFPAHLERSICNSEVLNMGVPGYGIDQAVLKYLAHGRAYAPDTVILGIFPDDYERSSVPFHAFSKPWFMPTGDGRYRLSNQPVPAPPLELARIRKEDAKELFSLALLRNLGRQLQTTASTRDHLLQRIDGAIVHALHLLQQALHDTGSRLLIVHIPGAEWFTGNATAWQQTASTRLKEIYRSLDIHYIDLGETFPIHHSPQGVVRDYYVHRSNGTTGHLSPQGNAETARLIIAALQRIDRRLPPAACGAPPNAP